MDIRTAYDAGALALDFALDGADLATDEGLETAAAISLFTDRRAGRDDALPGGDDDRRGWWGDAFAGVEGDLIGSKLWLLGREKNLPEALNRARDYGAEALAWMVEDGIAERVEVVAAAPLDTVLLLGVAIFRPNDPPVRFRFERFWNDL